MAGLSMSICDSGGARAAMGETCMCKLSTQQSKFVLAYIYIYIYIYTHTLSCWDAPPLLFFVGWGLQCAAMPST